MKVAVRRLEDGKAISQHIFDNYGILGVTVIQNLNVTVKWEFFI